MKKIILIILVFIFVAVRADSAVIINKAKINACLKNNNLIWQPSNEKGNITIKARFKETIELQKKKDGNWYRYSYKIAYSNIEIITGEWNDSELSFLVKDSWPTPESGIMLDKQPWPFQKNGYMIFEIIKQNKKNIIVGFTQIEKNS